LTIRGIGRIVRDVDALQGLRHAGDDYATRPIASAFNWQEASADLGDGEWYLVAFRSIRKSTADEARLEAHDEAAHQEAAAAPGFVHYYKGPKAADGSCLSFCLWSSRVDARAAAGKPLHVSALTLVDEMYSTYTLEFHRVTRTAGGPLSFEPYDRVQPIEHVGHATVDPDPPTQPALPPQAALRPAPAS
jgi:hypothetical protein